MCRFIESICVSGGRPSGIEYHRDRIRDTLLAARGLGEPQPGNTEGCDRSPNPSARDGSTAACAVRDAAGCTAADIAASGAAAAELLKQVLHRVPESPPAPRAKLRIVYRVNPRGRSPAVELEDFGLSEYRLPQIRSLRLVEGGDISYRWKHHDRRALERLHRLREGCDDIVILREGLVTDSSYCNLAFYDGIRWLTPAAPLLPGTRRARLMDEGRLEPAEISAPDIARFSHLALFNAMIELGELVLPTASVRR